MYLAAARAAARTHAVLAFVFVPMVVVLTVVVPVAASAGAPSGPLALAGVDGSPVSLALGPDDEAVVMHFWATWCPSCVVELPVLDAAARACPKSVRVVAVNVADEPEAIRRYLARFEPPLALRQLRDVSGDVWRRVSGRELPVNLVWTRHGAHVEVGPRDAKAWSRRLEELGCR